eukprot:SAG31_NODE_17334_length_674_cov_1.789565_1_plen_40_part_10
MRCTTAKEECRHLTAILIMREKWLMWIEGLDKKHPPICVR